MPRIMLTDLAVRKLPHPESGQVKYRDTNTPNFGLIVGKRTKTFFVTIGEERRNQTVGRFPDTTLKDARKQAVALLDTKDDKRPTHTLKTLTEAFLDDCRGRLRSKSVAAYETVLKHAPNIPLADADKTLVRTAHEIKAYKAMFNWAIREELYDRNPFQHLTATFGKRDRVLTDDEIKAIWHYDHEPYSTIVKLLLLTGQRRTQIWKLQPDWIGEDTINFPAEIMKAGKPHTIPLTPLTKQYLSTSPFSFNGWSKAKVRMDKHTGVSDYTLHDLRRTFATIHAQLGTPIHVAEAQLDHSSGTISGVAAIYFRHNWLAEMRQAMQRYEAHIAELTGCKLPG